MRPKTIRARPEQAPVAILAAGAAILGAALAAQYLGGLAPCELCHYQRWAYVAAIALAAAALRMPRARRPLTAAAGLVFAVGAAVAFYHVGIEQGWFRGPGSCAAPPLEAQSLAELKRLLEAAPVVRCDEVPWSLLGISLAGYNLLLSSGLALASFWAALAMARRTA